LVDFLEAAAAYRHHYWQIRACRFEACRRRWYRRAAKEKGLLQALGYSFEVVRLYGLALRDPSREERYKRFEEAFEEWKYGPKQLSLF